MTSIDAVADEYVEKAGALDPFLATWAGVAGHDHELPDLSEDGFAARAGLDRATLAALAAAEAPGPREQVARAPMRERLSLAVECYEAGDTAGQLNVVDCWVQYVREAFDLMPTDGEEAAATIAKRLTAVPNAYRQLSQTLLTAARGGRPPARLQVQEASGQCAGWAAPGESFYTGLVRQLTGVPESLRGDAGTGRPDDQRTARDALRHPAAGPADRGQDRAGQRWRDLLRLAVGGLVPARPDVVVGAGRAGLLRHLEGGHEHLPRGRSGPPPAVGPDAGGGGEPQPVAAPVVLGARAR